MAQDTPADVGNLVIYSVFVRQHSAEGTFAAVEADLPRIRALGVDVVWLLPIHPIGEVARKGSLGSPYAIRDYRAVNPAYGTLDDLARLVRTAHRLGLRVMIDVVYNHTAPDSRLVAEHPEYFHQDAGGRPVTTVPEWSDVIDLRHGHPGLTGELISTLEDWARLGVDGFRCDVASLVPAAFWREARARLARVKPGVLWLAENVHAVWVAERREAGLPASSDSELYDAGFDLEYDYDIWMIWRRALSGDVPVRRYLEMLRFQDCIFPATFVKMRCVENHDQPRIMEAAPSPAQARAWTAFQAFNRGAFLVYAGQEAGADHRPSLFEAEPIAWNGYPMAPFITRLAALKREPAVLDGRFVLVADEPAIVAAWVAASGDETLVGVFNVGGASAGLPVRVQVPDGICEDLLGDRAVTVEGGTIAMPAEAAILRVAGAHEPAAIDFELLSPA